MDPTLGLSASLLPPALYPRVQVHWHPFILFGLISSHHTFGGGVWRKKRRYLSSPFSSLLLIIIILKIPFNPVCLFSPLVSLALLLLRRRRRRKRWGGGWEGRRAGCLSRREKKGADRESALFLPPSLWLHQCAPPSIPPSRSQSPPANHCLSNGLHTEAFLNYTL